MARLDGLYSPESKRSFSGALAHGIIRRHLEGGPIDDVPQACREEIGAGLNHKLSELRLKPSELRGVIEEVDAVYTRFTTLSTDGFEHAEVALEHEPSPGVTLRGRVDATFRSEAGVTLTDWKTGGLGDPEDQLGFYALLWALDRNELPVRVEACSVGTGERFVAEPGRKDLAELAAGVSSMVDTIRDLWADDGARPITAGPWCRYCPIVESCVEGSATVAILDGSARTGER